MENVFLSKVGKFFKRVFLGIVYRLRPRFQFRWILTFSFWVIVLIYVGFGVFFGFKVYAQNDQSDLTRFSTSIYPFPAVTVGGNIIWMKTYYKQWASIDQFYERTKQTKDKAALKKLIVDQLIENKLISWEALKYGVRISSKDIDDAYKKVLDESGGEENVKTVLRDLYGMTQDDFRELLRQQVTKEKVQDEVIAQVKVAHIFVKNESRANEVANKAKSGEDWNNLAKTYSEDVKTRDNGGDLGWIARGVLEIDNKPVPEFEEAAFAAKIGEIFGPIKTQAGFQVGKVSEKKGRVQQPYISWLESLRKTKKIFIFIK